MYVCRYPWIYPRETLALFWCWLLCTCCAVLLHYNRWKKKDKKKEGRKGPIKRGLHGECLINTYWEEDGTGNVCARLYNSFGFGVGSSSTYIGFIAHRPFSWIKRKHRRGIFPHHRGIFQVKESKLKNGKSLEFKKKEKKKLKNECQGHFLGNYGY